MVRINHSSKFLHSWSYIDEWQSQGNFIFRQSRSALHARVTTGAAPCTLAQSDVEASRCGCFAHAMHSVQGAARCANHRDAPRCRCTQVVMHRGARCTSVHGDARRAKMRCLSQYLTSLVFLVLLQCCPRVKETFNRAGIHLGAGAHSVQ